MLLPGLRPKLNLSLSLGASGFTPARLALWAWYDFSDTSTLFQDESDTPVTAESDPVGGFLDLSGNERHASRVTDDTHRALYKLNQINGWDGLLFDGSNDAYVLPEDVFPATWTAFAVGTVTGASLRHMINFDGATRIAQVLSSTATNTLRTIGFNTAGTPFTDTAPITAGVPHVFTSVRTASSVEGFVDGVSNGGVASTGTNQSGTLAGYIGSNVGGGAEFFSGPLGEIIICSSDLSAADRTSVETYLRQKWGIS